MRTSLIPDARRYSTIIMSNGAILHTNHKHWSADIEMPSYPVELVVWFFFLNTLLFFFLKNIFIHWLMIETKLLLAYSFNTPTCECVCIYIYILSTCIYTHICPYRHLGVCPYAHTVGKCFTSVHLCLALCYRIGTQSNIYSENKLRLNFNARFSEINRIFSPGIRPPLIFSMHCAFVPYRFYVIFY